MPPSSDESRLSANVVDIRRFSTHDGHGIRTIADLLDQRRQFRDGRYLGNRGLPLSDAPHESRRGHAEFREQGPARHG